MATFEHDMAADRWTRSELIANLGSAAEDCDLRREFFKSCAPSGHDFNTWKRHALAVAAAVKLLTAEE